MQNLSQLLPELSTSKQRSDFTEALKYRWSLKARKSQLLPPGDWTYWAIISGRGFGKTRCGCETVRIWKDNNPIILLAGATAGDLRDIMIEGESLDIMTPIPTPHGWTTMEYLKVGDKVFDETGAPCSVIWVSKIADNRPCYEVGFSDGETIIADAKHKWFTWSGRARRAVRISKHPEDVPSVVTTEEIAKNLFDYGQMNHAIPLPGALQYPEKILLIHPYVLGAWMGDGRVRGGDFTSADQEIIETITSFGYKVTKHHYKYAYRICGIDPDLKTLKVIGNKHIPDEYLFGSIEQRLWLLRGIMDTDGYISPRGQCAFDNNNLVLMENVRELIRGLGMTVTLKRTAKIHASFPGAKPMYRLTFQPTINVFQLSRKTKRIKKLSSKASWRMIRSAIPCDSVPVKCISVDSKSSLFLVGKGCEPTHNSGIMAISPPWDMPRYESSKSRLTWKNGAIAFLRSADEPERFRGLQFYKTWVDELAAWRYPEAWDQIQMGLRLGKNPQALITTTPRPIKILKDILSDPNTVITRGSSYENKANLSKAFFDSIIKKYEGTRLGRQEIDAEMLEDVQGALWKRELIDLHRVQEMPELVKCVIPIDPAVSSKKTSDESGIIPMGMGANGHIYVFDDLSGIYAPKNLMTKAITAYEKYRADKIVAEVNNGGEFIKDLLRLIGGDIPYAEVWASRGKVTRAQPVLMLYEQGRVHHVGSLPALEDEMCTWDEKAGDPSPNRIDSLVWGATYLTSGTEESEFLSA